MQNITDTEKFKEETLPNKYSININNQKTEPNKNKKISKIEYNIFIEEKEENTIKKIILSIKKIINNLCITGGHLIFLDFFFFRSDEFRNIFITFFSRDNFFGFGFG